MLNEVVDGVYYLLDSRCPVCPLNYDLLEELFSAGVFVIGLSRGDDAYSLMTHSQEHGVAFPIVMQPEGGLMDIMPAYGTPLALVFVDGKLTSLFGGAIEGRRAADLRTLSSRSRSRGQSQPGGRSRLP